MSLFGEVDSGFLLSVIAPKTRHIGAPFARAYERVPKRMSSDWSGCHHHSSLLASEAVRKPCDTTPILLLLLLLQVLLTLAAANATVAAYCYRRWK